jgi:hypothetical protein
MARRSGKIFAKMIAHNVPDSTEIVNDFTKSLLEVTVYTMLVPTSFRWGFQAKVANRKEAMQWNPPRSKRRLAALQAINNRHHALHD